MDRSEKPPIVASFLVVFDQKVGYTIAWKRTVPGVDLDGVEYQCLPSGLHAVKEDLVYFVHGGHAGISVFAQGEADAQHRNASFVSVGALVPLSYGRLGRAWNHADELRRLASTVVSNASDTRPLELYWTQHRADRAAEQPPPATPSSPVSQKRKRALSDATIAGLGASSGLLAPDHPALSMPAMLDAFGPLLFPLHRAALLRKRILLLGAPPVQRNANAVYNLSVLASIPHELRESTLPVSAEDALPTRPLFSVGIHDMAALAAHTTGAAAAWLACTTDDILGEKRQLYDLLVRLPASGRQWPELRRADGGVVKASQRDLRRWRLLRRELGRARRQCEGRAESAVHDGDEDEDVGDNDRRPLLAPASCGKDRPDEAGAATGRDEGDVIEPASWTALAYRGFMWWASAGEATAWENDEAKADEELLFDLPAVAELLPDDAPADAHALYARAAATLAVAYFRRLTAALLKPLAEIVESADDDTEEGLQEGEIVVSLDDVREMGLDTWSESDKAFVAQLAAVWFQREVAVAEGGVRVCGVHIC